MAASRPHCQPPRVNQPCFVPQSSFRSGLILHAGKDMKNASWDCMRLRRRLLVPLSLQTPNRHGVAIQQFPSPPNTVAGTYSLADIPITVINFPRRISFRAAGRGTSLPCSTCSTATIRSVPLLSKQSSQGQRVRCNLVIMDMVLPESAQPSVPFVRAPSEVLPWWERRDSDDLSELVANP